MRKVVRAGVTAGLAPVLMMFALTVSWSMSTAVTLAATTALIMGGTGTPNPDATYREAMTGSYVNPFFGTSIGPGDQVTVVTPEEFWPTAGELTFDESVAQGVTALEDAITNHSGDTLYVVGYSQSTRIQAITKRNMITQHGDDFSAYPDITFVMAADLNKPNGGLLQRLPQGTVPGLGLTADGSAPTNSPQNPGDADDYALDTADFSFVYDGFSDFPAYSLNQLAVANAIAGMFFLHPNYPVRTDISPTDPDVFYQGSYGDTDYYMIKTDIVPLLMPLGSIDALRPLALFLDEPLRVLIETGYERETSPGEPTPGKLLPRKNPITVASNFLQAIPVGFDDAADDLGYGRPLKTQPAGPFGVGGPTQPIEDPTEEDVTLALSTAADEQPTKSKKDVDSSSRRVLGGDSPRPLEKVIDALTGKQANTPSDDGQDLSAEKPERDAA